MKDKSKSLPKTTTCNNMKEAVSDPLTVPKLAFFASVAAKIEPSLKKYQTAQPMAVFLYNDVGGILRAIRARFLKKPEIENAKQTSHLVKIDVTAKAVRCTYKKVNI